MAGSLPIMTSGIEHTIPVRAGQAGRQMVRHVAFLVVLPVCAASILHL